MSISHGKAFAAAASIAAALLCASCQNDGMENGRIRLDRKAVKFEISGAVQTARAGEDLKESGTPLLLTSEDGQTALALQCEVTRTADSGAPDVITRGMPVDGANIDDLMADSLHVAAYRSSDGTAYIPAQLLECVTPAAEALGKSIWTTTAATYSWPSDRLEFWGWGPVETLTLANDRKSATFSYVTPSAPESQPDVILAQTICAARDYEGKAPLEFIHAMSAVRFKLATTKAGTIKSVSIGGVLSEGTCEFTPSLGQQAVEWSGLSNAATFTNSLTQDVTASTDPAARTDIGEQSATFMLIPQNTSDVTVAMVFHNNETNRDETYSSTVSVNWKAGYTYTYVLSNIGGSLEIKVEDKVTGTVKSDLKISSTDNSTVKCFVRALIIGNWYENNGTDEAPVAGRIVAPWSIADGAFTPALPATAGASVNDWILGADGYYYYRYPVYPGTETGTGIDGTGTPQRLFTSYSAPTAAPIAGTYLKVDIVAQAVKWDAAKALATEAWGSTAAGFLSASDK